MFLAQVIRQTTSSAYCWSPPAPRRCCHPPSNTSAGSPWPQTVQCSGLWSRRGPPTGTGILPVLQTWEGFKGELFKSCISVSLKGAVHPVDWVSELPTLSRSTMRSRPGMNQAWPRQDIEPKPPWWPHRQAGQGSRKLVLTKTNFT